ICLLVAALAPAWLLGQPAPTAIQPDQARPAQFQANLGSPGLALAYNEADGTLVVAEENGALQYGQKPALLGVQSGESTPLVLRGPTAPVTALGWSTGPTLASGGADGRILLWSMSTGAVTSTLTGSTGIIRALAMSPDGKLLASGGDDAAVYLWEVASGK